MKPKTFNIEKFAIDVLIFRIDKKLSRYKLRNIMGIGSCDSIISIENQKRKPSVEIAFALCELMGERIETYMR